MAAQAPPPKPWERNRSPASTSSLPAALSAASATQQGTEASTADISATRIQPARPWEQNGASPSTSPYSTQPTYSSPYNSSASPYSSAYGSSPYNSSVGGYGAGSSLYNRGMGGVGAYGGSSYGGGMYNRSMYGGGMYGSSSYGGMAGNGYGSSMYGGMGGPYGGGMMGPMGQPPFDQNNPMPQPPTAWQHFMVGINGLMTFFGRLSFLVDENAHAVHFFISALLTLLDRAGSLYGELARFILRLLGRRRKGAKVEQGPPGSPHPAGKQLAALPAPHQRLGLPAPQSHGGPGQWDNLWRQ